MSEFWAYRNGDNLTPADSESAAIFSRVPFGSPVHVEVKQPRNGKQMRLYWALCQRIANAVGADAEGVSDLIKLRTGHVHIVSTKKGIERFPRSISFAKMDGTSFSEFLDKAILVICEDFGMSRPDVLAAVQDLIVPTEQR